MSGKVRALTGAARAPATAAGPEATPRPLRVAMLTSSYPRYPGDVIAPFIEEIAAGVARLGHEVHVIAPHHPNLRRSAVERGVHLHFYRYAPLRRLARWGYAESLVADVAVRRSIYAVAPLAMAGALSALGRLLYHGQFDLVQAHWAIPNGPLGALAARAAGLPLVVSLHGSDVYLAERSPWLRRAARRTLAGAQTITACSSDLARRAEALGAPPERGQVIPYGVDPEAFACSPAQTEAVRAELGLRPDQPLVLAVGRLVFKKGFEYLLRAVPAVLAAHPGARFAIAGEGDLGPDLRRLARTLGVEQRVEFPGAVDRTRLPAWFGAADLVVVPSVRDHAGNVDGLPNVVLEAMAAGRAVVASAVAGIPAVVTPEYNGLLVAEKDPAGLAAAIADLLADRDRRRSFGEAGQRRVRETLNWDTCARAYVESFRSARARWEAGWGRAASERSLGERR